MATQETIVHCDTVSVVRNKHALLDDFTWTIRPGERWVVLGPNGAGKTTTIQGISGRLFPTSGTIDVLGMRLGRVDVRQEIWPRVALASAALDYRFPQGSTVADIVRTGKYGYLATWREEYTAHDDERVNHLLDLVGITYLRERQLMYVSSGERKRVAIARALMADPRILIMDEPSSGLDMGGREMLMGAISNLLDAHSDITPILITHHVEEIPAGFTHALLMKDGRNYASGPLEDVLTSSALSELFGVPLQIERRNHRFVVVGTL